MHGCSEGIWSWTDSLQAIYLVWSISLRMKAMEEMSDERNKFGRRRTWSMRWGHRMRAISLWYIALYIFTYHQQSIFKSMFDVLLFWSRRISQLHIYTFIPIACAFLETKCLDLPAVITASNLAFLQLFHYFNPLNSHDKVCYQCLLCSKAAHTEMTLIARHDITSNRLR